MDNGVTVNIANGEIELKDLIALSKFGTLFGKPDEGNTIYLRLADNPFSRDALAELAVLISSMRPDECDVDDGVLRLWWD